MNSKSKKARLEKLEEAFREAAKRPIASEVMKQQEISFIMGMVGKRPGISREYVRSVLNGLEGRGKISE